MHFIRLIKFTITLRLKDNLINSFDNRKYTTSNYKDDKDKLLNIIYVYTDTEPARHKSNANFGNLVYD